MAPLPLPHDDRTPERNSEITAIEHAATRPKPLTVIQCRALAAISRRGPSTSRELAEEFGMRSKASLTRTLRTLVAHGLLAVEQIESGYYGERRYSLTPASNDLGYRYRR